MEPVNVEETVDSKTGKNGDGDVEDSPDAKISQPAKIGVSEEEVPVAASESAEGAVHSAAQLKVWLPKGHIYLHRTINPLRKDFITIHAVPPGKERLEFPWLT